MARGFFPRTGCSRFGQEFETMSCQTSRWRVEEQCSPPKPIPAVWPRLGRKPVLPLLPAATAALLTDSRRCRMDGQGLMGGQARSHATSITPQLKTMKLEHQQQCCTSPCNTAQGVAGIEKTMKWKLFFFIGWPETAHSRCQPLVSHVFTRQDL